jgi:CDP-4-dehydro-6-deoxyglucose reductase/3-phenylpropionate/trans-cinnamate dioxygenase ferredoxin reductase subunit
MSGATFTVRIAHSEMSFPCAAGETLLDAAHRAGFDIPYSCRKGVCMTCQGGLLSGAVGTSSGRHAAGPGTPTEILFCQARPIADVVIAPRRVARPLALFQPREVQARVFRLATVAPSVVIAGARAPPLPTSTRRRGASPCMSARKVSSACAMPSPTRS